MLAKFAGAAAGKNRDERFFGMEVVSGAERGAIESGFDVADERMADEFCGDAGVGVELFFEGEDAEGLGEAAADDSNAPGTPGPELRADVVGVGDFAEFEFAGEAEMEAGEVGEDGEGGLCFAWAAATSLRMARMSDGRWLRISVMPTTETSE